ncbi:MAG: AMMECR1 domain-containing protein [Planctomycetota bacterium]
MNRSASLLLVALATACSSPPPAEGPPLPAPVAEAKPEQKPLTPMERARNLFGSRDFAGARRALEEALEQDSDNAQALYLRARTLAVLGEYRGAKADCQRVLQLTPENALALDLLASLHEHLGEHREAIAAYQAVQAQLAVREQELSSYLRLQGMPVPQGVVSHGPLVGMARCYLYLGEADQALGVLAQARAASAQSDPWVEYWRFVTLDRMGRQREAEDAARTFVREAQRGFETQLKEVQRWLARQAQSLAPEVRQAMIDYVRAATRLRLPDQAPPGEEVLARAPERLLAFDDRPVFVTVVPAGESLRFFGRGRGKSLAGALKGAVEALQEDPRWKHLLAREAAVRVEVGRELRPARLDRQDGRLELTPPLEWGVHGVGLRADGKEAYLLPGDPVLEDLSGLEAGLEFACRRAGAGSSAWQSAGDAVFRFETEAFVSPRPGTAPQALVGAEPVERPEPTLRALRRGLDQGVRFLTRMIQPKAGLPAGYSPTRNAVDHRGGDDGAVAPADARETALALLAFRRAAEERSPGANGADALGGTSERVLEAAGLHLLEHGLGKDLDVVGLDPAAQALLLEALAGRPEAQGGGAWAPLARQLVAALRNAPRDARLPAARALLVASRAGDASLEAAAWSLAGPAENLDPSEPAARALLVALARGEQGAVAPARARLFAWGQAALSERAPATPGRLEALVVAAQVAAERKEPQAGALRELVVSGAGELLALQLGERHRWLCASPVRALGGFRDDLATIHLRPGRTAECVLALIEAFAFLSR